MKHMNRIKLFTVELNQGHRGETKLFVNEGIKGNIADVLFRLKEYQKPGDCIFDLCSLRGTYGEFAILRTSKRDADNSAVRDILNENSGLIRIRLGEILSFKIFDGPFVRVWVTFEDGPKVSWSLLDSGKIDKVLHLRLEQAVRIREGKTQGPQPEAKKPYSLEHTFAEKKEQGELSPSQHEAMINLHVVEDDNSVGVNDFNFEPVDLSPPKAQGRKTPKATRRYKKPDLQTGTNG